MGMVVVIETGIEEDGRPYAVVQQFPGVMAYGATREEAIAKVQRITLEVLAEEMEEGDGGPHGP